MSSLALLITLVLAGWLLLGLAVAALVGATANLMTDHPGSGQ